MAQELTFYGKDLLICPVCGKQFRKEQLRTGRGRLVSKDLTIELRRVYVPTEKFGDVFPMIYAVIVCPQCYYAAFPNDFEKLKMEEIALLVDTQPMRMEAVRTLFPDLDFVSPRRLAEGVSSYILAMDSYEYLGADKTPTIRQALSALRAAWLFSDFHARFPADNYDYLMQLMYRKSAFFYGQAIEKEFTGKERVSETPGLGPDIDKNYGFDGVLYLYAYLEFHYGPESNKERRLVQMKRAKSYVGRIFGMGKSNRSKPEVILMRAKDLFDEMGKAIKKVEADG